MLKMFKECDTIVVQSACGFGKTKSLNEFVAARAPEGKRIVFVSFRKTLSKKHHEELVPLGFVIYDEVTTREISARLVVVQMDSVYRVVGDADIVVLDECESTFAHLITFVHEKKAAFTSLANLVQKADMVICMDALMGPTTVNFLTNFKRNPKYYLNEDPIHANKALCPVDTLEDYYGLVLSKAKKGRKIYCPVNVVRVANELYDLLKVQFPHLRIGLYTKDTMLAHPRTYKELMAEWANLDIVICSPTIVAGISFENPHFDYICAYFSSMSSMAEISHQQNFRVREVVKGKIYICIHQIKSDGICKDIKYAPCV